MDTKMDEKWAHWSADCSVYLTEQTMGAQWEDLSVNMKVGLMGSYSASASGDK